MASYPATGAAPLRAAHQGPEQVPDMTAPRQVAVHTDVPAPGQWLRVSPSPCTRQLTSEGSYSHCFGILSASPSCAITWCRTPRNW